MPSRSLEFNFSGDTGDLDRAFQEVTRRAEQQERQIARLEEQQRSYQAQLRRTQAQQRAQVDSIRRTTSAASDSGSEVTGWLTTMIGAALAVGPAAAAAATGFAGFALVAAPSIIKVVQAQQDLAASWDTLSDRQRVSAVMVSTLTDDYHSLAESYEPQALAAFNNVVSSAQQLMPRLSDVVDASGASVIGLGNRIGAFVNGADMTTFIDRMGEAAPGALDDFGRAAASAGSAAVTLAGDALPLGTTMLTATRGLLGAANAAAHVSPTLTQVGIAALLLRTPVTRLVGGVGSLRTGVAGAAAATRGMTVAQRAATLAARAGVAPYVALAAGIFVIAARARSATSETEKMIDRLRINADAVGNNLAGHKAYAGQLERVASVFRSQLTFAMSHYTAEELRSTDVTAAHNRRLAELRQSTMDAQKALDAQRGVIERITSGSAQLSAQYGITQSQARQLATAAGVDLSQALDKSGKLTNDAAAKIRNYYAAAQAAKNPTQVVSLALDAMGNSALSAEDRVNALNTALNAFFNPSIAAYEASTRLKLGMRDLEQAMADGKGRIDGTRASSLRLQQAFASQLHNVANLWSATNQLSNGQGKANSMMRGAVPVLFAMAGENRHARNEVANLARSTGAATSATDISRRAFLRAADAMGVGRKRAAELWKELQKLRSRNIDINVDGHGFWTTAHDPGRRIRGLAFGGAVPAAAALGSGGPTADDVPTWLSVGEHVITAREVQAAGGHDAIYRMRAALLRGEMQGFAKGGAVSLSGDRRSTKAVVGEVVSPIKAGMNELFRAIANSMAAQWKRYAQSGGPVVAAARTQLGVPYVWGGTAWGRGLDCSGLTSGAWQRGAGVWIGRTTYDQYPHSTRIGVPRPGALGFPHLGHVVLATGRGTIIEAPYTGARVREVGISRNYDWRWPNAARRAEGGPIERAAGEAFLRDGRDPRRVALLGLAGDPGALRAFASGGLQAGYALGPTLLGERTSGGEAYVPLSPSRRTAAEDLMADVAHRFGGVYARRVAVSRSSSPAVPPVVNKTINIQPGAHNEIAEPIDIDLLMQRIEFYVASGGWSG